MKTDEKKNNKIINNIEKYKDEVKNINNETAITHRFSMLLDRLFTSSNPKFVEDYLKNVEKIIETKERDIILKGRLDAFYGNVVIEFKKDLNRFKEDAIKQQKKYLSILLEDEKESKINYLSLITDGVLFYLYVPKIKNIEKEISENNIELQLIEEVDIFKINSIDLYYFLDRYLFGELKKTPTFEEFVKDFGINSPAFNFMIEDLKYIWEKNKNINPFDIIFNSWDSYLSIVYGAKVNDYDLFLRHTYLSALVKLLVGSSFLEGRVQDFIYKTIKGEFFKEIGIINFLEEDFFSWVTNEKVFGNISITLNKLNNQLNRFNLKKFIKEGTGEDILKELYQELVDPSARHELGEYYTPDWLAEKMVKEVIESNPDKKFLDPSCGSGTFLYYIIKYKKKFLQNDKDLLDKIVDSVSGIDIHPLAVTISKTNYILALGDLLLNRDKRISIPVYLSDSIKISKLEEQRQLSLDEKAESISVKLLDREAFIPKDILISNDIYDSVIELLGEFSTSYKNKEINLKVFENFFDNYYTKKSFSKDVIKTLFSIAEILKDLVDKNKDSIWIYILKNLYKPYFLLDSFDVIIGNPPWLSYSNVERSDYQKFLKDIISDKYNLCSRKSSLISHLEIATLFFIRCIDLYSVFDGKICFLLPRSIFTGDQHNYFRRQEFKLEVSFDEVWDLLDVSNIFNVPSCVLFGSYNKITNYPVTSKTFSGKLPEKNIILSQAIKFIKEIDNKIYLAENPDRSFWTNSKETQIFRQSYYKRFFAEGAIIIPRSFWFIDFENRNVLGSDIGLPLVKTSKHAIKNAKEKYSEINFNGNIEKKFLFQTLLSKDIVPFGYLDPRDIILPIELSFNKIKLINDEEEAENKAYIYLSNWINKVEGIWKELKGEKSDKYSAIEWLDYRHNLTKQGISDYKVIYAASGKNIVGTVVKNDIYNKVNMSKFVVDHTTYYYNADSLEEAYYLSTFLNSNYINKLIKPMQSMGLFGQRHVHTKIWEFNIPKYNPEDSNHKKLYSIGFNAFDKVGEYLKRCKFENEVNFKKLRKDLRIFLKKEIEKIDHILEKIMK